MNKTMALDTLFYPFETGLLPWPVQGERAAFFNAQNHSALRQLPSDLYLQQYFKPYAQGLQGAGFESLPALPEITASYDAVFVALPKNRIEAEYLVARGLMCLKQGGLLIAAADNKAGGNRIVKMLEGFGVNDAQSESKNKCRVVWAKKESVDQDAIALAMKAGEPQKILDGQFISQPGVFGWNKIDKGSEILLQHLPNDLKGRGADFGCGYGLLSCHILQHCDIKSLICIDADQRAVEICCENVKIVQKNAALECMWEDLTKPLPRLKNIDFIVMNPPFHEGKVADVDIGKAFINNAYERLRKGGALWMVANSQLPYEIELKNTFYDVKKIHEGQGFKIFCCKK